MYDKKSFKFGSVQESIAINVFNQNRNKELLQPIFSVVSPDKSAQLLKQYRGILFPEERFNDLRYVNKADEMFKKLRKVNLYIQPL